MTASRVATAYGMKISTRGICIDAANLLRLWLLCSLQIDVTLVWRRNGLIYVGFSRLQSRFSGSQQRWWTVQSRPHNENTPKQGTAGSQALLCQRC